MREFAEYCLQVHETCADHLSNNLRLNEISILIFLSISLQNKQKPLEIVVEATYGLHPHYFSEILNLKI